ncbi:Bug family tripartite tricarboxylate transporter substrate binding protein [Polynucleobacter rarus]|uniref:Bug family tripartite tricarboxylate transporter substrate binding protein n=1 Tax=Polynucleobacter rarus TaxID=556055 RepID=UPI000D3ECB8A|nr:tripartite tricarboxylate transporter substrate-binding protein [Polynucleobacter rarus]
MRTFLIAILLFAMSAMAQGQSWPNKPIKLIVGTASGGGPDAIARVIASRMGERLGQTVIVELKPGGSGQIASEYVALAPADGNTWLLTTTMIQSIIPQLKKQLPYDPVKDFYPVSLIGTTANVLVVGKHLGVSNASQFVSLVRSKPGKLTFGSAGVGSPAHLAGELFATSVGVPMTHISYKGATQALVDIAGGQVDMIITSPSAAKTIANGGKVLVLATTGLKRDPLNPQLQALSEVLPDFEITQWWGLMIRSGTPKNISDRIYSELVATLSETKIKEQLAAQGGVAQAMESIVFGNFILSERNRYAEIIRKANVTPDN